MILVKIKTVLTKFNTSLLTLGIRPLPVIVNLTRNALIDNLVQTMYYWFSL